LLNNTFNALKLVGLIFTIVHIGGYVTNWLDWSNKDYRVSHCSSYVMDNTAMRPGGQG
jgi:hypothetical protein